MPISNLQRPDGVTLEEPESHNETFGRFSATPFERGYGDTCLLYTSDAADE